MSKQIPVPTRNLICGRPSSRQTSRPFPLGPGNRVATFTHHEFLSGREFFPNNVQAGDNITIPSAVGRHPFILDAGGLPNAAVGFVVALLEEDDTPDKAMRAGHEAFAEAVDAELNGFVDSVKGTLSNATS